MNETVGHVSIIKISVFVFQTNEIMLTSLIQCQYCNTRKFFKKPAWKISFKNFWQSVCPPSLRVVQFHCHTGFPDRRRSAQTICIASARTCHQTKRSQFVTWWMRRTLKKEAAKRRA